MITSWNQGAQHLFGYTACEMIGQPVLRLIPEDRQGRRARILEGSAGENASIIMKPCETQRRRDP